MRRTIILLFSLLAMSVVATAQPVAYFDRMEHDFGTILWKKPVTAIFHLTNKGNQPLVITHVSSDCGCTDAEWPQEAISPGESGNITATFDAGMLGRFYKSIGVYCNANEEPIYLELKGKVASELEDYETEFPCVIGNLRLEQRNVDFGDIHLGDSLTKEIRVINTGETDYTPTVIHLPSNVAFEAVPQTLHRKQTGKLRFTMHPRKETAPLLGLTETQVYLARYMGDKISEENVVNLHSILLPDFSKLTPAQRALPPVINVSTESVHFLKNGKKKQSQTVLITNTSNSSTLRIEALQTSDAALNVSLKKNELKPKETVKLKVSLSGERKMTNGEDMAVILITNDPHRPKVTLGVTIK